MKHLNELTLLALVKNSLDKDEARKALLHIEKCDICLKKLRLIKVAIAPQKPVEPSKDVLSSILHYYSSQLQYYDKKTFKNTISNFVQTYRRSIAFTFSILIVGILITIFILKPGYKSIPHILYVADIKGKNVLTQTLIEGQRIK
ncbi:MAG: hypothetical protein N3F66_05090, partial [Spirochaetes bacterium]|nr:hypothetical protein [Spirochaetota bacterium]